MSIFGDNTPAQELLEWIEMIQRKFDMDDQSVAILLLHVTLHYMDSLDQQFQSIQLLRPDDV